MAIRVLHGIEFFKEIRRGPYAMATRVLHGIDFFKEIGRGLCKDATYEVSSKYHGRRR